MGLISGDERQFRCDDIDEWILCLVFIADVSYWDIDGRTICLFGYMIMCFG